MWIRFLSAAHNPILKRLSDEIHVLALLVWASVVPVSILYWAGLDLLCALFLRGG
jgi:hypothetical protein